MESLSGTLIEKVLPHSRTLGTLCLSGFFVTLYLLGLIPNRISSAAFLLCALALSALIARVSPSLFAFQLAVAVFCSSSLLIAADLLWRLRPPAQLSYRPEEIFLRPWFRMRKLARYAPNVTYHQRTYGDLAAMVGRKDLREYRDLAFKSDAFGFPNPEVPVTPLDLVLLGNSFGAGSGTTQEKTWATLFAKQYGMTVYNLSIPATGPWHELMDLKAEFHRLKRKPINRTIVLWALFAGNDLDDTFPDILEPTLSDGAFAWWYSSAASFRDRSPIRQISDQLYRWARRKGESPVIERVYGSGRPILFRSKYALRVRRTQGEVLSHENTPRLRRGMDEMAQLATREGFTVAVVLVPAKEEVYSWILDRREPSDRDSDPSALSIPIREQCARDQFPFLDLKPFMVAEAKRLLQV